MRFSRTVALLGLASVASAELPTLPDDFVRGLVVSQPGTAEVCPLDYHLYRQDGETSPAAPPITITKQDTTTVEFSVKNLWAPSGVNSIYVEYTIDNLGSTTCVEEKKFDEFDTIDLKAYCLYSEPISIVNVYVADPEVTGDAKIPECCHGGRNRLPMNTVMYTYVLQCEPTCDDEEPECVEKVLDFNDLPEYSYVYDEYWHSLGVTITARSNTNDIAVSHTPLPDSNFPTGSAWQDRYGFTEGNPNTFTGDVWDQSLHKRAGGAARVFNTLKPDEARGNPKCEPGNQDDGDHDLGSPNESCPGGTPGLLINGPGTGGGGAPGTPHPNCPSELLGNVLIVQEGAKSCPDDTASGGTITFDFNPNIAGTVEFTSISILDIDDGANPTVYVWTQSEDLSASPATPGLDAPNVGDNGLWIADMDFPAGIKRIKVEYPGSGSLAEIRYKPSKCVDKADMLPEKQTTA